MSDFRKSFFKGGTPNQDLGAAALAAASGLVQRAFSKKAPAAETSLTAHEQAEHDLSMARAFGETPEHLRMLREAETTSSPTGVTVAPPEDMRYSHYYGGGVTDPRPTRK